MQIKTNFSRNTLIGAALLMAVVGFTLGLNYQVYSSQLAGWLGLDTTETVNEHLPERLDYESVDAVYDALRQKYDGELTVEQLLEGLKAGLVNAAGDPYTVYLDEAAAREFQESLEGTFSGIGAEIAIKNNRLVVQTPLSGTPADQAGLRPGDFIAEINGSDTSGITIGEAVNKIRGEAGTAVELTIVRGNQTPQAISITRAVIEVPSVEGELKPGQIGYLKLNRFGDETKAELLKITNDLTNQGAEKFILDMRNNPGGLLQAAVEVADVFLSNQVVVEQRRAGEVEQVYRTNRGGLLVDKPLVVLINGGSASASEIVAGALRDHEAATIVGESSFGKGSVQELVNLPGRTLLKVTVARWYTPAGDSITAGGIEPDEEVELSNEDFNADRDPQLMRALELLR